MTPPYITTLKFAGGGGNPKKSKPSLNFGPRLTSGTFSVPTSCSLYNRITIQYNLICAYMRNKSLVNYTRDVLSCAF